MNAVVHQPVENREPVGGVAIGWLRRRAGNTLQLLEARRIVLHQQRHRVVEFRVVQHQRRLFVRGATHVDAAHLQQLTQWKKSTLKSKVQNKSRRTLKRVLGQHKPWYFFRACQASIKKIRRPTWSPTWRPVCSATLDAWTDDTKTPPSTPLIIWMPRGSDNPPRRILSWMKFS